jgi:hypothetical protein
MMKKLLFAAVLLSVIAGCKPKTPETPKIDVTGAWEMSAVSTKVNVGGEQVSVYLDFSAEGSFTLYQKIGAGRYTVFTGSYNVDQNNKLLSGTYSNGKQWGPYDCTCSESSLTLVTYGGGETYTYNKIDAVPSSVTGNTY